MQKWFHIKDFTIFRFEYEQKKIKLDDLLYSLVIKIQFSWYEFVKLHRAICKNGKVCWNCVETQLLNFIIHTLSGFDLNKLLVYKSH